MKRSMSQYASAAHYYEAELATLRAERDALQDALQAFVDRTTKLSGFPAQYDPYVGELAKARAALARCKS